MRYAVFLGMIICMLSMITFAQQEQDKSTFPISLLGEFKRAGVYHVRADRPFFLLDALALAGGVAPLADAKRAEITRDGVADKIMIDLVAVLTGQYQMCSSSQGM